MKVTVNVWRSLSHHHPWERLLGEAPPGGWLWWNGNSVDSRDPSICPSNAELTQGTVVLSSFGFLVPNSWLLHLFGKLTVCKLLKPNADSKFITMVWVSSSYNCFLCWRLKESSRRLHPHPPYLFPSYVPHRGRPTHRLRHNHSWPYRAEGVKTPSLVPKLSLIAWPTCLSQSLPLPPSLPPSLFTCQMIPPRYPQCLKLNMSKTECSLYPINPAPSCISWFGL